MAKKTDQKTDKKKAKAVKSKPKKKNIQKVRVRVKSGYNNTIVTITDYDGNVIASSSGGTIGFTGSKKSTAFAATKAAEDAVAKATRHGAKEAIVIVSGMGMGRQAAVKGIRSGGLKITSLSDYTPVKHGGTFSRKAPQK
ncbi:30S ribosomal protein S11 [Candidatus Dojkabacteria bacterium]|nr:30S ribosomal protein S11 [Candidatus Dojkabacteria bacterium]